MPSRTLIPSPESLLARLQHVDAQIEELRTLLTKKLTQAQIAGATAHLASLTQRRNWYLARLRSTRPVQVLGVGVADDVHTGDGLR